MSWENPARIAQTEALLRESADWGPADYYIAPRVRHERCSDEETAAFLKMERDQFGVDRIARTVRPGVL